MPRYPPTAILISAETERSTFRELTTAFRTNLTALGLLALVVGMFLIYGTMAFAILQRTQTLGILRTLGVSRAEILQTILWETAGIAAVATALGLLLGHVLAIGLVGLVLRTIGDLSFNAAVGGVEPIAMDLRAGCSARVRRDADRRRKTGARRRAHRAGRRAASSRARAPRALGGATRGLRRRAAARGERSVARVRSESSSMPPSRACSACSQPARC